ncbi:hemagglutinin repeat-containing protein [Collimonas silvisoli]|uniref:hemagglutinin repeat-containing protein n=1 Tax=Collimonas silvisoli TaxID=2825884 RepID=UPI001B8CE906|nr:hemagglutinin repeat-containing protein [Collimonas silvisoli]
MSISLTVGSSSSNSQSTQSSSTVVGSNVKAGGNVSITATGAGKDSNINVIGSNVSAGQDALLKADGDINLKAAQSTSTQQSTSSSNSGAVGIAATYGKDGFAFGITASASGSRGNGNGTDVTNVNSNVSAGNTLVLSSGHDTNIQGAVASGNQVFANVGTSGQGNLNIQSLQDTSTYKSKDQAIGGSVTIGFGASGSINASQSKVNGDYASVTQQSGIKAGNGGFVVSVNGNTDLKGGVIASTATPDKNLLVTQTLTQSDLQNHSSYSASAVTVGGGYGVSGSSGGGGTAQGANLLTIQQGGQGSSMGVSSKDGSSSGTSYGGVSAGTVVIGDDKKQQALTGQTAAQAVTAVNHNVGVTNAGSISKDWNGQQLNSQVTANAQIVAAFGQQAATQIGNYADKQRDALTTEAKQAADNGDFAQAASLQTQAAQWDEGGEYRVALHTAAGALTGNLAGAAGALVSAESMKTIGDAIGKMGLPMSVTEGLQQVAAAALGAVVGGGAGAASSVNVVANNLQLDPKQRAAMQRLMEGKSLSEQQDIVDAACALVHCSAGVPDSDKAKGILSDSQQAGQQLTAQQQQLIATGVFPTYGSADAFTDALTYYQVPNRATGAVQGVTGAAIAVGSVTGGCATLVACGLGAVVAGTSADYSYAGFKQLVDGNLAPTYGEQVLQSFGMSPGTAALAYGVLNFGGAAGGAMLANQAAKDAGALNTASRLSYTPIEQFGTQGLKVTPEIMRTPQAQAIMDSYIAAGASSDDAFRYTQNLIKSGSNLPQPITVASDTELIKIVPKGIPVGDSVGSYSPFFMTRQEYDVLSKLPGDQIANRLGLPAEQAIRGSQLGFDVYSMTPKVGSTPTAFTSQVAPIQQGTYSASGGAQQVMVPNRAQWTDPNTNKIAEIGGVH